MVAADGTVAELATLIVGIALAAEHHPAWQPKPTNWPSLGVHGSDERAELSYAA